MTVAWRTFLQNVVVWPLADPPEATFALGPAIEPCRASNIPGSISLADTAAVSDPTGAANAEGATNGIDMVGVRWGGGALQAKYRSKG